jgi:S-adenosylmethionine:tRNA ribosyltransferase-isomerase
MKTADFDFDLPEDRIALRPADPRDSARLLVVKDGALDDRVIRDLPDFLQPGDALVFNDTRVIPARLSGVRTRPSPEGETLTVAVEATLHHRDAPDAWSAFMKPGKRIKPGDRIRFGQGVDAACDLGRLDATVTAKGDDGLITLRFDLSGPALDHRLLMTSELGHYEMRPAGLEGPDLRDLAAYIDSLG